MEPTTLNIHADHIEGCKAGDPRSQQEIYRLYSKAMLNTAFRIVGSVEDAEDILQESFVSAFRNIQSYRQEASFGAWLKRIVVNKSLSWLRSRQRQMLVEEDVERMELTDEKGESRDLKLSVELVRKSLMELPDGFRSVVSLYLFEGYDHKEIGDILNISESTSKSQYSRAKLKLREMLQSKISYG